MAATDASAGPLPELASVYWRPRMTAERLRRRERLWTLTTLGHVVPFVVVSLGLLGDLVDHEARALHARTGLVPEPGRLGTWLVGEAGALLVAGRRVSC